jgi:hypothetical protein
MHPRALKEARKSSSYPSMRYAGIDTKSYTYIAGPLSARVIKIGTTKNVGRYQRYPQNRKYGSLDDLEILYCESLIFADLADELLERST